MIYSGRTLEKHEIGKKLFAAVTFKSHAIAKRVLEKPEIVMKGRDGKEFILGLFTMKIFKEAFVKTYQGRFEKAYDRVVDEIERALEKQKPISLAGRVFSDLQRTKVTKFF